MRSYVDAYDKKFKELMAGTETGVLVEYGIRDLYCLFIILNSRQDKVKLDPSSKKLLYQGLSSTSSAFISVQVRYY